MADSSSRRAFLLSGLALPAAGTDKKETAAPSLRFRTLGSTGLRVTELGFGSEAVSDITVFQRALDAGINFFDTARSYEAGNSERALGAALKGRRNTVVLSSRSYADNAKALQSDLDLSLKELGTDRLDIWYIGSKDRADQVKPDMLEVQNAAKKAGKIRFRGFSTHRIGSILPFILEQKFDVVQIPYNFALGTRRDPFNMDATGLDAALDRMKQAGIGVVAMKVMAGGYREGSSKNPNADIHARAGARQAAIRWALRDDRIQSTSVRMVDADQFEENLRAMRAPFTEADRRLLASYTHSITPVYCRMCGACDGACPKGMPVSDVVRFVMYAEAYGQYEMGRSRFAGAIGKVHCGECDNCAIVCPNGVAVRTRMNRAQELFC